MESTHPLVSVGIPTYNRPDGLKRTLECMLAQTYANLEIIVSDNASPNKDVEKIARDFATRDTRVSFYRQKENHGPTFNFAFVLQKANGEYFVWAADDDEWETTFISKCVEALRKYPEAILSFPWSILTDKTGKKLEVFKEDIDTHGLSRILRIRKVLQNLSRNTSFYGVFKRSALYKEKMPQHYGGDHIYMTSLCLHGEFINIPEPLFYSCIGGSGSSPETMNKDLNIASSFANQFPNFLLFMDFLNAAMKWHGLTLKERILTIKYIIMRFTTHTYLERMKIDFTTFLRRNFLEKIKLKETAKKILGLKASKTIKAVYNKLHRNE